MSKFKKVLSMGSAYVLVASLAIGATIAYLSDTDSDVNVMTVGNVDIEQLEYERVVDEDGNWISTEKEDEYGYKPDDIQEFTQNKPALPAVYQDGTIKWDDRNGSQAASGEGSHQQSWGEAGAPGSNQLFDDSVKNVIDKFVFVMNDGKTDAYYRTVIAVESPENNTAEIHLNRNGNSRFIWDNEGKPIGYINVKGSRYALYVATYNEILKPGEISRPSLLQLFLDPTATNEDCAAFGDAWEVLVVSQAVQADMGDMTANEALDEAFYDVTVEHHPWNDGVSNVKLPGSYVYTVQELYEALEAGGEVTLGADITVTPETVLPRGNYIAAIQKDAVLNLNGYDISFDLGAEKASTSPCMFYVYSADLTIKGEGTLSVTNDAAVAWVASGGGNLYIEGGNYVSDNHSTGADHVFAIIYSSGGEVHVHGGTFTYDNLSGGTNGGFNVQDWWGHKITLYEGVLLSNEVYRQPQDTTAHRIRLAEGCNLKEVVIDGVTWYQVVSE